MHDSPQPDLSLCERPRVCAPDSATICVGGQTQTPLAVSGLHHRKQGGLVWRGRAWAAAYVSTPQTWKLMDPDVKRRLGRTPSDHCTSCVKMRSPVLRPCGAG